MALCLAAASAQENRRITKQELSADVPKEASPENEITSRFYKARVLAENEVTCSFDILTHAAYQNEFIEYDAPEKQSKPLIVSFTDLDSTNPSIRYMDVLALADESKAISVGNAEKVVLIDVRTESRNVDVFAIYRRLGIAVWTRNYENPIARELAGQSLPTGRIGVGRCQ
jgi:hypothetical protein